MIHAFILCLIKLAARQILYRCYIASAREQGFQHADEPRLTVCCQSMYSIILLPVIIAITTSCSSSSGLSMYLRCC